MITMETHLKSLHCICIIYVLLDISDIMSKNFLEAEL